MPISCLNFLALIVTAMLVKNLDSRHMVTTGLEGKEDDGGRLFIDSHSGPFIDFATIHLWVCSLFAFGLFTGC